MGALFDGFDNNQKGGGRWRKSDRCHLRPCDTGGNSSEASTASGPHVALAGAVIQRGGVGGAEGVEGGGTKPLLFLLQSREATPIASKGREDAGQGRSQ